MQFCPSGHFAEASGRKNIYPYFFFFFSFLFVRQVLL